jgi:ubiquinone/menaquinone biosynthesis C-methylase UbiE
MARDEPTEVASAKQLEEVAHQEWTDEATVAAWRKWHPQLVEWAGDATKTIVQAAQVTPGMQVLDLASGTGEPALALAGEVGADGHITATDLVPGMLAAAEENARHLGLTNISFQVADAEALPFPDRTFDVITCRFGVMYFPNHGQALREARRVLKPCGRAAFLAWGPFEQPLFTSTEGVLMKYVQVPLPRPGSPNPFAFARTGTLASALREVGFQQVQEEVRTIRMRWPGPVEQLWQYFEEIAGPFHPLLKSLDPKKAQQVIDEVYAALRQYSDGRRVDLPALVVLACGTR